MIVVQQFQILLYLISAVLIYLIIFPTFLFFRIPKFLFLVLFLSCIGFHFWQANISFFLYGLYVVPVFLILSSVCKQIFVAIVMWFLCNVYAVFHFQAPMISILVPSSLLVTLGLMLYRQKGKSKYLHIVVYPSLLFTVYGVYFLLAHDWIQYNASYVSVSLLGGYISSICLQFIYDYTKKYDQLQHEFSRIQQHEAIKQLTKSIAHTIRNPLTVTYGFLQLLRQKRLTSKQVHTYCAHAYAGMKEADGVITDYLRCVEPKLKISHHLHVQAEIDKMISQIAPVCAQLQIEIIIRHLTKQPLYIAGEENTFYQSIFNLITNAIEAMPAGGKLEVTTWLDDESVHIHIEDTGIGIDTQKMKRIGTPFYDDLNARGTGLGLMIVVNLVAAMNGTISYYSHPNEGTACWLQYKQA